MEPQGKAQIRRTESYKPVVVNDRQVIVVGDVNFNSRCAYYPKIVLA